MILIHREAEEAAERAAIGDVTANNDDVIEDCVDAGNPFKRLDKSQLVLCQHVSSVYN